MPCSSESVFLDLHSLNFFQVLSFFLLLFPPKSFTTLYIFTALYEIKDTILISNESNDWKEKSGNLLNTCPELGKVYNINFMSGKKIAFSRQEIGNLF